MIIRHSVNHYNILNQNNKHVMYLCKVPLSCRFPCYHGVPTTSSVYTYLSLLAYLCVSLLSLTKRACAEAVVSPRWRLGLMAVQYLLHQLLH